MKRERKAALGIGGIVIVAALVGLALFLTTSSQLGVGFIAVGIPALLVIGVGAYVRGVVSRSGTSQTDYTDQQAKEAANTLRDVWTAYDELQSSYPAWDASDVETDFEHVADDLGDQGVKFDTSSGSYSTKRFGSADVQDLERVRSDIDDLERAVGNSFESFVRAEIQRLRGRLDALEDAGLTTVRSWNGQSAVDEVGDDNRVEALTGVLAGHRGAAADAVADASEEVESLLADADGPVDEDRVRGLLADAERRADEDDYQGAVEAVLDAQAALEGELAGRFDDDREAVGDLLETVEDAPVEEYVSSRHVERVEDIRAEVATLDSALDVSDLRAAGDDLRAVCTAMVEELTDDVEADLETLASADVPADYYDHPSAVDEQYAVRLRDADSLETFRRTWLAAVGDLTGALDDLSEKASVAQSYGDIERRIEDELRAHGTVTGDDLPVKQPGGFMELYARSHPEAAYDPAGPTLSAGDGETYDVSVLVQFEAGGPKRGVTVELEGTGVEESERCETHLAEEVVFEDVPFGDYTVRAVPEPDDFRTPEEAVSVETDAEVELLLAEVGLREQVCEGVEADIREYLPDLRDDLRDQYDEEGYLSSSMSYPVTDEYVPCLLALWAEDAGLAVTRAGDDVVAYDDDQLTQEIEMVVEHNVGPGERMSYEECRTSYLSAALPDDVIRSAIEDSAKADSVETTDTDFSKES